MFAIRHVRTLRLAVTYTVEASLVQERFVLSRNGHGEASRSGHDLESIPGRMNKGAFFRASATLVYM